MLVIIAYFNGSRWIDEQLRSICSQVDTKFEIELLVVDDSSSPPEFEALMSSLRDLEMKYTLQKNNQRLGHAKTFMGALCSAPDSFDYYSFCDQDDIWSNNKVERTIEILRAHSSEAQLSAYCSRTYLIDEKAKLLGNSKLYNKPPSFGNAIVQNIAAGNTLTMNNKAKRFISSKCFPRDLFAHDWWIYLLVTGCGGKVVYDAMPTVYYRQHGRNQSGSNTSLLGKIKRFRMLVNGEFREAINPNLSGLTKIVDALTPENRKILLSFISVRNDSILSKCVYCQSRQVFRQSRLESWLIYAALIIGKL
jgi:glycosyltransferase involved in cell wall biosynthesis